MPEQLSFDGFGTAQAVPADRLFFAIFPDASAAGRIARLARDLSDQHGLKGKPFATARFHISLFHLGDFVGLPQRIVMAAKHAAARVAPLAFDVTFDRAVCFRGKGNRPLVLCGGEGFAPLIALRQSLRAAMKPSGSARGAGSAFTPHVTLLYDDRTVAEQPVEAISWTVRELFLVHSLIGQSRYIRLGQWRLQG
jgi:2'-5' RNA ligase